MKTGQKCQACLDGLSSVLCSLVTVSLLLWIVIAVIILLSWFCNVKIGKGLQDVGLKDNFSELHTITTKNGQISGPNLTEQV